MTITVSDRLKGLAKDLSKDHPRSPRVKLGGYIIVARTLDKCRAHLAGTVGEYHYNCPLDNQFFSFAEINGDEFAHFVATGASDERVAEWIQLHAKQRARIEIIKWNNDLLFKRLSEMPEHIQEYMEDYVATYIPQEKVIYHWFDIYDIEEGRL